MFTDWFNLSFFGIQNNLNMIFIVWCVCLIFVSWMTEIFARVINFYQTALLITLNDYFHCISNILKVITKKKPLFHLLLSWLNEAHVWDCSKCKHVPSTEYSVVVFFSFFLFFIFFLHLHLLSLKSNKFLNSKQPHIQNSFDLNRSQTFIVNGNFYEQIEKNQRNNLHIDSNQFNFNPHILTYVEKKKWFEYAFPLIPRVTNFKMYSICIAVFFFAVSTSFLHFFFCFVVGFYSFVKFIINTSQNS